MSFRSNFYATVGTAIFMFIFVTLKNENVPGNWMESWKAGLPMPTMFRFPYQVSITLDGEHRCSGSIVDEFTVVTSVDCVTDQPSTFFHRIYKFIGFSLQKPAMFDVSRLGVKAGSIHIGRGVTHSVSEVEYHEDHNPITKDWDVAVIKVMDPFKFGMTVRPVSLADNDEVKNGANAVVSGWGKQSEEDKKKKWTLKYANLPIRGGRYCDEFLKEKRTDRMMCAGITKNSKDYHWDETGSPLVSNGKLIGISLWDEGRGTPTHLGVFTKVSSVHKWIKSRMASG